MCSVTVSGHFFPYFVCKAVGVKVSQAVSRAGLAASPLPLTLDSLTVPPGSVGPGLGSGGSVSGQGDRSTLLHLMVHLACVKGAVSQTLAYPRLFLPPWGQPAQLGGIDSSELNSSAWGRPPGRLTQTSSGSALALLL